MSDLTLFDVPRGRARAHDRDTAKQAASGISRSAEDAIVRLYSIPRALTDDELRALMPEWHGPTVISARSRLARSGFLCDSGERRPSARNRMQIVWIRQGGRG